MAKLTFKCPICEQQVTSEQKYEIEYINSKGNPTIKKGHKVCVEQWHSEYLQYISLHETLIKICDVPGLPKNFITRIRELHHLYKWDIIKKTVLLKKKAIQEHFNKGWNYIFAIINNSIAQVYKENKEAEIKQKQQECKMVKPISEFDYESNYQQRENKGDISSLLD